LTSAIVTAKDRLTSRCFRCSDLMLHHTREQTCTEECVESIDNGSTDIPGIPHESWLSRIKEVVLADYSGENPIYAVRSNLSYRRREVK